MIPGLTLGTGRLGNPIAGLFGQRPILIGMVHLMPLPGSPGWGGSMRAVLERGLADSRALAAAGFDGILIENFNDHPFYPNEAPQETVAALAVCAAASAAAVEIPIGVNLLRNDGPGAMAVAVASGARFIRVNVHTGVMASDQGWLEGRAHETLRLRGRLGQDVRILGDVLVKHAAPLPGASLEQLAEDTFYRGCADALILSGRGTGRPTELSRIERVRAVVPDAPLFVGSGVTFETLKETAQLADGIIVGTSISRDEGRAGSGIDPRRADLFVRAARST